MPIKRKELFGFNGIITTLKDWCNSKFSLLGHTHTKSQITDFPKIPSGMICWFYLTSAPRGWVVCDGTNGTPNLIGRYPLGATSRIGSTVEAGLPNITGTAVARYGCFTGECSGALSTIKDGKTNSSAMYDTTESMRYVIFNASRSNSVYGNSPTVTPPSTRLLPCMKI